MSYLYKIYIKFKQKNNCFNNKRKTLPSMGSLINYSWENWASKFKIMTTVKYSLLKQQQSDIELNTQREIPKYKVTMYYCVYFKNILQMTFLMIIFPEDIQALSENYPKLVQMFLKIWRCFHHTPTILHYPYHRSETS